MPASPCHTYSDPEGKAAWQALNTAETKLESILHEYGGAAQIGPFVYFLDESKRMLCTAADQHGTFAKEEGLHREDYEGMSNAELFEAAGRIQQVLDLWDEAQGDVTAENYQRVLRWNGFELISTGGGSSAWRRPFPAGRYLLITNEQDKHTFHSDEDMAVLVAYNGDDRLIGDEWHGPLARLGLAISLRGREAFSDAVLSLNKNAVIEEAINTAVKTIQDALGVTTGDTAGMFFTGEMDQALRVPLRKYMDLELQLFSPDFEAKEEPSEAVSPRPR
jgi:hypothetical protein